METGFQARKTKNGFAITFGGYTVKLFVGQRSDSAISDGVPVNAEVFFKRNGLAHFNGTFHLGSGKIMIANIDSFHGVQKSQELKYAFDVLLLSAEVALRPKGAKTIFMRTHRRFAEFLKQIGYRSVGAAGTSIDVEKKIRAKFKVPAILKPILSINPASKQRMPINNSSAKQSFRRALPRVRAPIK